MYRARLLKRKNKRPIVAEDIEVFVGNGETVIIEYAFLRDDAITLDDEEVEFITRLGEIEVRRAFTLEDMVLGGELVMYNGWLRRVVVAAALMALRSHAAVRRGSGSHSPAPSS